MESIEILEPNEPMEPNEPIESIELIEVKLPKLFSSSLSTFFCGPNVSLQQNGPPIEILGLTKKNNHFTAANARRPDARLTLPPPPRKHPEIKHTLSEKNLEEKKIVGKKI